MLTVIFATRNRAPILHRVLGSYCNLHPPESGWKLIVVDNGSTDKTREVLAAYESRLPLSWLTECNLGKNCALNAGLPLVEGDLAVFTDDDVFPFADWLVELRRTADCQPAHSIFGGTIVPKWEAPPPSWLHWIDLAPVFTITPSNMEEGELPPAHVTLVQGPNMAIRASIFQSGTRFNTSIGPSGSNYPMGSETELILRLHRQGHRAWHVNRAVVEHLVRQEQLNKAWVLRRAIRFGRGWGRMAPNPKQWLGIPRYLVRDVPKEALHMAAATVLLNPKARFQAHWRLNYLLGEGYEALVMDRERRQRSNASIQ